MAGSRRSSWMSMAGSTTVVVTVAVDVELDVVGVVVVVVVAVVVVVPSSSSCVVDPPVVVLRARGAARGRIRGVAGSRRPSGMAGSRRWPHAARPACPASDPAVAQPAATRNTEATSAARVVVLLLTVVAGAEEVSDPTRPAVVAAAVSADAAARASSLRQPSFRLRCGWSCRRESPGARRSRKPRPLALVGMCAATLVAGGRDVAADAVALEPACRAGACGPRLPRRHRLGDSRRAERLARRSRSRPAAGSAA